MTSVHLIVLNWNDYKDTKECINSINKLNTRNIQLKTIVVDNGSTDGSPKKLDKLLKNKKNTKLLKNKKNLGYAGGNNAGLRQALETDTDYIMVLNNDTRLHKNILQEFIKIAKKHPSAGILSPKIYFEKGSEFHKKRYSKKELGKVLWWAGGEIDWNNVYAKHIGVDEVDKGQYDQVKKIEFATGACMFFKPTALRQVGLFDESYFLYLEDADICMRMKKKKWSILYVPKAVMWHKVAKSSGIGSQLNDYYLTRNRMKFGMKYAGIRAKFALFRESARLFFSGRRWQKIGIYDFWISNFGKGSWK